MSISRISRNMLAERSFPSRAAFTGATIPDHMQTWTVIHAGVSCDYVRDASGTAITSANGVNGSPAGDEGRPQGYGAAADGVTDDFAELLAWAAAGSGNASGTYAVTTRTAPLAIPASAMVRLKGSTILWGLTIAGTATMFTIGDNSSVDGMSIKVTGTNYFTRGANVNAGAGLRDFRFVAETPFPSDASYDTRSGILRVSGPDVTIDGAHFDGAYIRGIADNFDETDRSNLTARNIELRNYAFGTNFGGAGSIIDGLIVRSIHPNAGTDPGENAFTEGAANSAVFDVVQLCSGSGSGEHFVYSAVEDGTRGMRFSRVMNQGSGQCFMKFRGHDEFVVSHCHGGGTSYGNTPGTNEDGFRFEYCRNGLISDYSIRGSVTDNRPAGYDGIHLNNCWGMTFTNGYIGPSRRAAIFCTTPPATAGFSQSTNSAVEDIVINGLTAMVESATKPFLLFGAYGAETAVKAGNITITGLRWDGDEDYLVVVDTDMTLTRQAGTHIHISGVLGKDLLQYDWAAADPTPTIRINGTVV